MDSRFLPELKWRVPALLVAATLAAALMGSAASIFAADVYSRIAKPAWAPPGWLFGPVWTLLYITMAVAAVLVWQQSRVGHPVVGALALYLGQLVLNALWTWIFFHWRRPGWALAEIVVLWALVLLTLVACWRVRTLAGVLLLPYLAWVTFAVVLTAAVWRLNPLGF